MCLKAWGNGTVIISLGVLVLFIYGFSVFCCFFPFFKEPNTHFLTGFNSQLVTVCKVRLLQFLIFPFFVLVPINCTCITSVLILISLSKVKQLSHDVLLTSVLSFLPVFFFFLCPNVTSINFRCNV